ncbi:MAG: DNA mismatch repair endonuclease MutL [Candidatus Melainabacteria bacterium]|nr:DNA mismatch repair endonuclease MutL [Candidatus Melainabacteria bacterium]
MPKVAVLPDHIASQIAAGEVVERPASVIKELVENSIDAGATHIEISVSHDMRDIRVADNGFGMDPDDAVLAFQRHATSKLACADDLSTLMTLGFRGEALPSIASISKFTCYTRTRDAATGTKVEVKEGNVIATETGCSQGTVMEIAELFYNVPARLKFLKKANTEFGHSQEIVQSLAVAHPHVVFEMRKGDTVAFRTGGTGDTAQAATDAKMFSGNESFVEVSGFDERFGLTITGVVARPNHFRGDRKGILSVVNQRPVRCPLTYKALEYAYSDLIPRGRHPFAVINIQINPEHIDVNIHPTKKEIKYTDSNAIYMALHRAIGDALRQPRRELMEAINQARQEEADANGPRITFDESVAPPHHNQEQFAGLSEEELVAGGKEAQLLAAGSHASSVVVQSLKLYSRDENIETSAPHMLHNAPGADFEKRYNFAPDGGSENSNRFDSLGASSGSELRERTASYDAVSQSIEQLSFRGELGYVPSRSSQPTYEQPSETMLSLPLDEEIVLPAGWRLAGYIHNTYFLFETPEGMEVIEQHIAHERTLYERILASQTTRGRISEHAQRLCISSPLNLSAQQADVLKNGAAALESLGFEFEFGEDGSASCTQVPLELAHQNYANIIHKMVEDLADVENANIELEATKSIACQSAIKNGMHLSTNDIIKLVSAWLQTPRHDTCPHGRPVRLKLSMNRLFEMFHPV